MRQRRTIASFSACFASRGRCSQIPDTGNRGIDRLKFPPDALGGVGLHVERVDMARASGHENQDHRTCAGCPSGAIRALGMGSGRENPRKPHTEEAGKSDLEELSANQSAIVTVRRIQNGFPLLFNRTILLHRTGFNFILNKNQAQACESYHCLVQPRAWESGSSQRGCVLESVEPGCGISCNSS